MKREEIIQALESIEKRVTDFPYMTAEDWVAIAAAKRYLQESPVTPVWHDASREQPKEKKVCLIVWNAKSGASTSNLEVAIANPQERRFVTESYPHKTGRQFTIHGENTFSVYEYMDKRDYIPFSDADKWAYADDLLQEPTNPFDSHIQEGDKITVNEDGSRFNRSQLERVVELSRYSKPYEAKRVKRTSADIEAAMKEIDELSKAFTEAHPEGGDQMLTEIRGEYHIVDNNEMVSEELEEAAEKYSGNASNIIEWSDGWEDFDDRESVEIAFKAGAEWMEQQLKDK